MKKLILAITATLTLAFGSLANAQYLPSIFWFGFTGPGCTGTAFTIVLRPTLETLWEEGLIRSYKTYAFGTVGTCQNRLKTIAEEFGGPN